MKDMLRWLLALLAVALADLASWSLYPLGRWSALLACPDRLRVVEATTDLSRPDHATASIACSAGWFPIADASLMVLAIGASVLAAGVVAHRLSPSHRRLSASLSSLVVVGLVASLFAVGS